MRGVAKLKLEREARRRRLAHAKVRTHERAALDADVDLQVTPLRVVLDVRSNARRRAGTRELPDDCTGVLSDGNETISIEVSDCISVTAGLAPAPLAKTGQTGSIAAGDDGALQKGVAWPNPRFTDNANGTVTDNLTGLIWLKDANCLRGIRGWFAALSDANNVANGGCGLSDGSRAGDWRLPNRNELTSLLDLNKRNPALPSGHPFTDFQAAKYWTSTANSPGSVWRVDFLDAAVTDGTTANFWFVTFVRDGR